MEFLRTIADSFRLMLLRRPARPSRRVGPGQFWLAALLLIAVNVLDSWLSVPAPRSFDVDAFRGLGFFALLALLISYATAVAVERPALFWPLATFLLLLETLIGAVVLVLDNTLLAYWFPNRDPGTDHTALYVWLMWLLLAIRRLMDFLEPYRRRMIRAISALAITAALSLPAFWIDRGGFFYPAQWDDTDSMLTEDESAEPSFDPEAVLSEQTARVDAAVAALAPETPGHVDLYAITFAGDGGEGVFRNEALYAEKLFAQRFDAEGRTLALINFPSTVQSAPLATLTNLKRAINGTAAHMDRNQDLLLVFMTSHGSDTHELYVALDPLPLNQITPQDLRAALDASGVRHRIVIVSACYSGGFIEPLRGPDTLVITAAREDRSSFGCGSDSGLTYFGRAFLADALNAEPDLTRAFRAAKRSVAKREHDEDKKPSLPQIASAPQIEAQLARWLAGIKPGLPVPFVEPDEANSEAATHDVAHATP